jgi:hypothetical protein
VLILLWALFAFAGVYEWTIVPLAGGAIALAAWVRPRIMRSPYRLLDGAILACLALSALQLVPVPPGIRGALSPGAVAIDRQLLFDSAIDPLGTASRPIALDPTSGAWALAVLVVVALILWCTRDLLARQSSRALLRPIATAGLVMSAIAIVQHATSPKLLYWYWHPVAASAAPYSPFVNRNDLATWLIMAIPLTIGYGTARWRAMRTPDANEPDIPSLVDDTLLWLGASLCLMLTALLFSMSRSGVMGGAVGLAAFWWLSRRRGGRRDRLWIAVAVVAVAALVVTYANLGALATRFAETFSLGLGGRRRVWSATWRMVHDFRLTGVGIGSYVRGMSVYQETPYAFYFNHAHNEYLQLLAEGGILLAVPIVVAMAAGARLVVRGLASDRTSFFWIRAGAAAGLLAVATQSIWDTGAARPANATLLAVVAAIATLAPSLTPRTPKPARGAGNDPMGVGERQERHRPAGVGRPDVADRRK